MIGLRPKESSLKYSAHALKLVLMNTLSFETAVVDLYDSEV